MFEFEIADLKFFRVPYLFFYFYSSFCARGNDY